MNTRKINTRAKRKSSVGRTVLLFWALIIVSAVAIFAMPGMFRNDDYELNNEVFATIRVPAGQVLEHTPGVPHIPGYRFLHWSHAPEGVAFDFSQPLSQDANMYAIWVREADFPYWYYHNQHQHDYDDNNYDEYIEYAPEYEGTYSDAYSYDHYSPHYTYHHGVHHDDYYDPYSWGYEEFYHEHVNIEHYHYNDTFGQQYDEYDYYHSGSYYHEHDNYSNDSYYNGHDDYDHDYEHSYDAPYSHSYPENEYAYEYAYEYAQAHYEPEDNYYYNDFDAHMYEPEYIYITFLWNHGSLWHGPGITVEVDDRANVTVLPTIGYGHGVTLSAEYVRIYLPVYLADASILGLNLPEDWTYQLGYLTEESEIYPYYSKVTTITVFHDLLAHSGSVGIMPLASGFPTGFTPAILQPPFDNAAWADALGGNTAGNNRVVIVPQNVDLAANLSISGNRHVIITSYGTNLQGTVDNHIAPPTTFVVRHTGGAVRHFTTSTAQNTLTLSHIILCGDVVDPATTPNRGGVNLSAANTHLYMQAGSVIRNSRAANGGGVIASGANGRVTMRGNASLIGNSATTAGGGIHFAGVRTFVMEQNALITGSRAANGAGVNMASATTFTMSGSASITNNVATTSGGGMRLVNNGSTFTMNGGTISGNQANGADPTTGGGGGIRIDASVLNDSAVTINNGTISNNHAVANGGGIFAANFSALNPLPSGAFPQLSVQAAAVFTGNTSGLGGFASPGNTAGTNIAVTSQRSGGFAHPINNLDINFFSIGADWFRLNLVINNTTATNIIIHPAGAGVTAGLSGANYNFVVTDPGDGSTITTLPTLGAASTHTITVSRSVTLGAAPGANIVLRMPVPAAVNTPPEAPWATTLTTLTRHFSVGANATLTLGGGAGSGNLTLDGNADLLTQTRGGVAVPANATLVLQDGGIISNNRAATGGGVTLSAATSVFNMTGGSISNNLANTGTAANGGGSVHIAGNGAHFTMSGGSISNNVSTQSGGGVALITNGSLFTMSGGTISGNNANGTGATTGGGGVFLAAGVNSHFAFNGGTISGNHANNSGGGVFSSNFTYANPLPAGSHFPQLTVMPAAIFTGNTANTGSFPPPSNFAATLPNIAVTAQRSGGYSHPLNNLDINFIAPSADWFRINSMITNPSGPDTIIIHPTGAGVAPGLSGSTYNLIISDPGNGSVITTVHLLGGTSAQEINVTRPVTILGADGADIVLRKPVPNPTNTPNEAPWLTTQTTLARHFNISGGGSLTIGGQGSGTLTLDGNANLLTQARGGVSVGATGTLVLQNGGVISNNRAATGGGVTLTAATSVFNMTGGSITNNFATTTTNANGGGGVHIAGNGAHFTMSNGTISGNISPQSGGGVALITNGSLFTMNGGTISGNNANGTAATTGGGGVFLAAGLASHFTFNGGTISGNHANNRGGGVFSSNFTYANPLPAGAHFPQLTVMPAAIFTGNTANSGGFPPPSNFATAVPNIAVTAERSGGFAHPLNNLDINFPAADADWFRLNSLMTSPSGPDTIIIHPAGSGVAPGLSGSTYNLIISDPGNGSVITTIHLMGGTSPHVINVTRPVTILGADGADIVLRMPVPNPVNTPNELPWLTTQTILARHFNVSGGGNLTIGGEGSGTLTLDGNAHLLTQNRGGVSVAATGTLVLQDGGVIYNNRETTGGGVILSAATSVFNMTGGSISNNFATSATAANGGGGVHIAGAGAHFTMSGGNISDNVAAQSGGGVALITNGSLFTMNGGTISGNTANGTGATSGGGGVFIAAGAASHFTFQSGTISGNHTNNSGGGVFTTAFTYDFVLPAGVHYPQLTVHSPAIFYDNTATIGSFAPPANYATGVPNIAVTAQRSGGYAHPLNNLDINFVVPDADWFRLHSLINNPAGPDTIVIHPTGAGVAPGLLGTTYNFIISDPGDGSTITTIHLQAGISPHVINVARQVTVAAANGANIVLLMPVPGAINTPDVAPWLTTLDALSRHFNVSGGGHLTIGGGAGFGTLTLDGNIQWTASGRGGISVGATGTLVLQDGGVIDNNRAATGGGVTLTAATSIFNMTGGSITNNIANTITAANGGGGVQVAGNGAHFTMSGGNISNNVASASGGGVALTTNGSLFTMNGGTISDNNANSADAAAGGGGVFIAAGAASHFTFSGGTISGNHSNNSGGGVFATGFTYANPLPAGLHYGQLTVLAPAIFTNNTARVGSFPPPSNVASAVPNIAVTAQRSGGFAHPLNNLDINFYMPISDWHRLNTLIINLGGPETIVIHPTGAGVTAGLSGTTYNFIITDPGDGNTITTIHLLGGTSTHTINVSRPVTLVAAYGADIVLRMPVPDAINTPGIPPWVTTLAGLGRHFSVLAAGNLTIGGEDFGTLTLDGSANLITANRGGIAVVSNAILNLLDGGVVYNSRSSVGGGVQLAASGAVLNMDGGSIISNYATQSGAGVAVGSASTFTMDGGTISGNTAIGFGLTQGGGGVFLDGTASTQFTFNAGTISNNSATRGGGVFAALHTYANPLPAGNHFPQLTVLPAAIFTGNTASTGSFAPPANYATAVPNIAVTAQRSGGHPHPLNNYDINFVVQNADWARLHQVINHTTATNIVIHPTGASVTPGLTGTTYNFVVTDPGDGSTITTVPILGGTSAHVIAITRPIALAAATGADIVLRMPAPGAPNTPNTEPWLTAAQGLSRHFSVSGGGNLAIGGGSGFGNLTLDGNADLVTAFRGGVEVGANGSLVLQDGGIISNNRSGVTLTAATSVFNMTGGSIVNNLGGTGSGVALGVGSTFTMSAGTIAGNTASSNGGGVALNGASSSFTMTGGTISGNSANGPNGGGGVFISTGAYAHFTFSGGTISNNHAVNGSGGGVFASTFTYLDPLPAGAHYPQLTIMPAAIFANNTAGIGSFTPPANFATAVPNIAVTAQRSGGYAHPLNNLDINFVVLNTDWTRLNNLIVNPAGPTNIVIHPTGAAVTPGLVGTTYNFIVSDPGNGSTITTVGLTGGTSPHQILVTRPVAIAAAPGANIVLRMPVPGAPNTANVAPWVTTQTALSRHFNVGANGSLTIGGGVGYGTLTLDGNANLVDWNQNRGGVQVTSATANLVLQQGGVIYNNRAPSGGGVNLATNGAQFTMTGGAVTGNISWVDTGGGGGVNVLGANSHFTFTGGSITNNQAFGHGGGINVSEVTGESPLPDSGAPHFPQLTIGPDAIFSGNTAGSGGEEPPANATSHTNIPVTAGRSGGFWHPLNDLDISFFGFTGTDWFELNRLVQTGVAGFGRPNPARIVIHPRGTVLGTPPFDGYTYQFVISDIAAGDPRDGSIIHAAFSATSNASAISIPADRNVTIVAAPGAEIVLLKPAILRSFGRHFNVAGANANLTLGDPNGSGILYLDGNGDIVSGVVNLDSGLIRGGVNLSGDNSVFNLHDGGAIVNNRYSSIGAGVRLNSNNTFNMYGGLIDGNMTSYAGGGVGHGSGSSAMRFNMHGGVISNNSAGFAGAVWIMAGMTTMNGGQIIGNTAGVAQGSSLAGNHHGMGGAFMICCGGRLIMNGGYIEGNTARAGGGVHLSHPPNPANPAPGVYSYFIMRGGNIIDNHATVGHINPAVLSNQWQFTDEHMMLQDENGGGLYIFQGGLVVFEDPAPALGIQDSPIRIDNNTADRHGGGVYWSAIPIADVVSRWYSRPGIPWMHGVTRGRTMPVSISNNTAQIPSVPTQSASTETIAYGGGIFMAYGMIDLYGNWNINDNTADRGGGIYVRGTAALPLTATLAHRDISIARNTAHLDGGGVYLGPFASINMEEASIYGNSAIRGGGIHIGNPSSTLNISGGNIGLPGANNGNTAQQGGGVWAGNGAQVNMTQGGTAPNFTSGYVMNNTQGLFITGMHGQTRTTFNMSAGIIGGSSLLGQGNTDGGVRVYDGALFNMTNAAATISGNSGTYGAGIHLSGTSGTNRATAHITAGTIGGDPELGLGNSSLNDGGGVFVNTGGFLHLNGTDASVIGNNANRGGGISYTCELASANTEILWTAGAITHNTATTNGGGIYLRSDGAGGDPAFNFHSGTLSHNTAGGSGGGMFVNSTALLHGAGAKIISNNTANGVGSMTVDVGGGGVYVAGSFTMEPGSSGLEIRNNSAPNGMGGGIFTVNHGDYPDPLTYNAAGRALHYQNLYLRSGVIFSGNTASFVSVPPLNAMPPFNPLTTLLPNINYNGVSPQWPSQGRHHPLNNFDINFCPGEEPAIFTFHKTGMGIYQEGNWFTGGTLNQAWINQQLRAGAHFALYAYTGTGTPDPGYVSAPAWQRMGTYEISSTNPAEYMSFGLVPGVYYQLVELLAPVGYQAAFGQWRIRAFFRDVGPIGTPVMEAGFAITLQGSTQTPDFVNPGNTGITTQTIGDVEYRIVWGGMRYVGNMPSFELPMSGGRGQSIFMYGGMLMLLLGTLGGALIYVKRRRRISFNKKFAIQEKLWYSGFH